jgi:hypothetical protein
MQASAGSASPPGPKTDDVMADLNRRYMERKEQERLRQEQKKRR